jgi:hypothetical protein
MFRNLKANEIEVRVSRVTEKGSWYLLYKDARADMIILDETVTPLGWQREHKLIGDVMYCGVSIKDKDGSWITKWDAGNESNTEAAKGAASDSFKRACVNWGIGRSLYTAPQIFIPNDKVGKYDKIKVVHIAHDDIGITQLAIATHNDVVVYKWQRT